MASNTTSLQACGVPHHTPVCLLVNILLCYVRQYLQRVFVDMPFCTRALQAGLDLLHASHCYLWYYLGKCNRSLYARKVKQAHMQGCWCLLIYIYIYLLRYIYLLTLLIYIYINCVCTGSAMLWCWFSIYSAWHWLHLTHNKNFCGVSQ